MSWSKSDKLVACTAGCGAEVKERRMKHHLRDHCLARYRKRNTKGRRFRARWGRKQVRPVDERRLLRSAKRIFGSLGVNIYPKGNHVVIEHRWS
jgi:hypothetical protein